MTNSFARKNGPYSALIQSSLHLCDAPVTHFKTAARAIWNPSRMTVLTSANKPEGICAYYLIGDLMKMTKKLQENMTVLKQKLPLGKSFDVIGHDLNVGARQAYLVFVDGFAKDDILLFLMKELQTEVEPDDLTSVQKLIQARVPYIETDTTAEFAMLETMVLSGAAALLVDGFDEAIILDVRQYPVRNPEESDGEKVTRGSKDGLVETLIFNTALIRRRIRDPKLVFELKQVGDRSKTDVAIAYIDDLADQGLLEKVKSKLDNIQTPALPMGEKNLEELLVQKKWYNPLPQTRVTERPDTAAAHLLEGHILLLVDTSPSAMILPSTLFSFTQYPEEYQQNPLVGTYMRLLRFLAIPLSVLLAPLWMLLANHTGQLPEWLQFIGTKEAGTFPIFLQLLLLEFGLDFLRLSSLQIPKNLGATLSIIGGLIIGEFAVQVGVFSPESIFYIALVAILSYCIPNTEFASAMRMFRLLLLILTGLVDVWGFAAGILIIIAITATTKTFDEKRGYLWPLFPFHWGALKNLLFRSPVTEIKDKQT